MALSGRINGTARSSSGVTSSYKYWCEWTATQNVAANTSTISGTLSVQCIAFANGAWSETTYPIVSIKVNGKTVTPSKIYHIDTRNYRESLFAEFSATVTHNNDGTLSCPIVATFDMNDPEVSSLRSGSLSGYATLDTIPRASKIAATDANIGSTSTITVTRYSTSFTHTVTWECLGLSGTIATKSTSTVIPWSVPTAIYEKIPNARQATVTLKCTTFSGSTQIGDVQTGTMRANVGSENAPSVSGSVVDINATTIALTGNKNSLIRYRSTGKCTISATPKNGATIKTKTVNGINIPDSFVEIPGVETGTFLFSVTDSREFPASVTVTKNLVLYIPLTINPIATRVSPTSNEIKLKFTGNFFKGSFGSLENTLTVKYRYRVYGTETWGEFTDIPLSFIDILDDGMYNSKEEISLGTSFDYQKSYDFEIQAQDGNGSTVLTSVSSQLQVSRGIPVFDWSNTDFHVRETLRTANVEPDGDVSVGTEQNPYAAGHFDNVYAGGTMLSAPLQSNIDLYVSSTGSDENDGLTTATPKATIQAALNSIPRDMGGCTATIYLRGGSINAGSGYSIYDTAHYNGYLIFDGSGMNSGAVITGDVFLGGRNMAYRLYDLSIKGNRASSYSVITFGDCARGEVSTCTVDGISHVNGQAGVRTIYNADMVVHSCNIKNCDYAVSTWMSNQAQRSGCMTQVRNCTGSNNRIGIYALTALVMSISNALGATTAELKSAGGQIFT